MVTKHGELARFDASEQELFDVAPEVPAMSAVETAVNFEAVVTSLRNRGEGDVTRIEQMEKLVREVRVLFESEYNQYIAEQDLKI